MVQLKASGIGKRFGSRILFRKLSFEISGGSMMAVTGVNGSGKSTLVRILAGVLTPTRGSILLQTKDGVIESEQRPFHVGLVAPYLNLYEALSPEENLRFIARARGFKDADNRINKTLTQVGLADRQDDYISSFSSGMIQRVRIAAALLGDPEVLLLDEPRSNLDAAGKQLVTDVIAAAVQQNKIVIVATNDSEEAEACGRQVSIDDFR